MSFNSLNKVMLLGRLGGDPEIKHSQGGTAIANFSLATSESYKDQQGSWQEQTQWNRIVVFGSVAENCGKFLKKGSLVFVEGRLQTRNYTDQSGVEKSITEIIAKEIKFLDKKE